MKKYVLIFLILLTAIYYIFYDFNFIVFKLIPMWLIILYAIIQFPAKRLPVHWLVITGLLFSMIGDWLISWSFVFGLSAFLIGHLFYLTGFLSRCRFLKFKAFSIIPIALYSIWFGTRLITALGKGGDDAFIVPVVFYVIVISTMLWSAIMTSNRWAIAGSLLFVISDSILSWNMFVVDIQYSDILIMTTYYAGQFLIAHSLQNFKVLAAD